MSNAQVTQMHGAGPTDRESILEVGVRKVKNWTRNRVQDGKPVDPQEFADILEVYFPEAKV